MVLRQPMNGFLIILIHLGLDPEICCSKVSLYAVVIKIFIPIGMFLERFRNKYAKNYICK